MNKKPVQLNFKKELARDFIALGGIPLFLLTLARVLMLENTNYFLQYFFAGLIFLTLTLIFKQDYYSGLALIVGVFLSNYYQDLTFTIFAILIYITLIISLIYIERERKEIIKGILFGAISIIISLGILKFIF
jgi:hypothetical protein